ncbi:MAG: hypothetical protein HC828_10250, partial [Blastochloris sp.]|nr:hypothetical protein [Blastochloris sp.]
RVRVSGTQRSASPAPLAAFWSETSGGKGKAQKSRPGWGRASGVSVQAVVRLRSVRRFLVGCAGITRTILAGGVRPVQEKLLVL